MLVLASLGSWLPFAIVGFLIIFFSITFTLRYQQKRNRDYLVTVVCSISLITALFTASLLPTDVILVSFMKNPNGTFKEWTQNQTSRDEIQKYVEIGYYTLYALVIAMAFLINPFLFFYYEEREEQGEKLSKRICSALKWTAGFLIFLILLIILGIFVPQLATLPSDNSTSEWDNVKYLIYHFDSSRVEDSISFSIFTLSIIGFLLLTIYTGYGSIACPLSMIRGKRSARLQQQTIEEQRADIEDQIKTIKTNYPRYAKMPPQEKRRLESLEQKQEALSRNAQSIKVVRRSLFFKCRFLYRPLQIVLGVLLLLFALLIFISLLLSNINKCIHFINFKQIYAQGNKTLPNPIDIIITWTGKFYPVSYIVLSLLLAYIIVTSLYGLQQLGIWFLWIRMYRFSRGRTKPQAILMLSSLMMFIVVAINAFVYLLIPQYSIYGDQYYSAVVNNGTQTVEMCTQFVSTDDCQMTVMGRIILRFFYKVWFFGAAYFLLSWLFLIVFLISCIVKIVRGRESNIQEFTTDRLFDDDDDGEDNPLIQ
ncbi:unnamed protein product [Rotaria socialis]|uniref:G-protein coupled receptors family 1 profile domain-containing protein n=1 Tax=Rotaria socialis TaxID=392032 RepID=A0A819XE06_9BILA|nr:unnamed protein product [Rotaria socialis]CAF3419520.1 unnamed protein product [Rotaria socialis]CAF3419530.1 unnamed protein product [Rotaria socialis]CAF3629176.1 unnamed protein product [Rotaria socialis]CAF3735657.1 unnamed protein product [Rotaria socialis]